MDVHLDLLLGIGDGLAVTRFPELVRMDAPADDLLRLHT
jgi:hypothetical protein